MHDEGNIEGIPLSREVLNTSRFFAGGGRETVMTAIETALQDQVGIITLIGEEGSGKSTLCKRLQEQWDTPCKVVFLPKIVKSFEDIVRVAALQCDLQYPAETNRDDSKRIFFELIASLRAAGESLLLICDEAEKMYLATLERLRKILDDVNNDGGGLQLLFSGRESLASHLEQLDVCDFEEISERQFVLSAFDGKDTWKYLNFCIQPSTGDDRRELFTQEAADKVASLAMGNLWRINYLADAALQAANAENSIQVLSGHVQEEETAEGEGPGRLEILQKVPFIQKLPFPPGYMLGGAVVLSVMLMFFVLGGDDEETLMEKIPQVQESAVSTSPVMAIVSPAQDVVSSPEETVERAVPVPVPDPVPDESVEIVPQSAEIEEVVAAPLLADAVPAPDPVQKEGEELIEDLEPAIDIQQTPPQHTPVEISPVEIVESVAAESELPELSNQSKIAAEKFKRIIPLSKKQIPEKSIAVPVIPRDPVLASLVIAGEKWQTGSDDARFSIQLMVLTSEQAEDNLKRIVLEPEYQEIVDKLVMLKRSSEPPVVLVFYGSYPTMAAARNARNNMPIFLRKHHPYAVSVRGAVEKARAE